MTESKSKDDFPGGASIPDGAVALESILHTEELRRRPCRSPDYEKENRALVVLADALADSQSNILQMLAETILEVTQCESSGVSLLTEDGKRFYWPAIAGLWKPHIGGGTPRDFGPCGDVLDRNSTLLFQHFERRYPYFLPIEPLVEECLLVPFYVGEKAVGTIWAITHNDRRKFDAEDERLMNTLGRFASVSYKTLTFIEDLGSQIAAREKVEAALHELATGLETKVRRRLVDASLDAIITIDEKGLVVEWSRAAEKMFGYSRDQAVGRDMAELIIPPRLRDAHHQGIQRFHETGEGPFLSKRIELLAIPANGPEFPAEISIVPIPLEGRMLFTGFIRDITERKRAEEERERLRRMQADLAHINRVNTMGELTASLAHEIKQPISAAVTDASTCLRWLARDPPDVTEAQEAASRLIKDTTRASDIISGIGSLFKKDLLQRELVDLNELIREMIVLLRSEAARFSISIHCELAKDLPHIMADRIQLQQVFMNLMLNGIEAMKEMGTPGKLTIGTRQDENGQLLVSVVDAGVGIQREQAERIFDTFFTTKSRGTGMGLPISRSIIESHGGHLWVTSNSGPGATFHFSLPVEVVAH